MHNSTIPPSIRELRRRRLCLGRRRKQGPGSAELRRQQQLADGNVWMFFVPKKKPESQKQDAHYIDLLFSVLLLLFEYVLVGCEQHDLGLASCRYIDQQNRERGPASGYVRDWYELLLSSRQTAFSSLFSLGMFLLPLLFPFAFCFLCLLFLFIGVQSTPPSIQASLRATTSSVVFTPMTAVRIDPSFQFVSRSFSRFFFLSLSLSLCRDASS